MKIPLLGQTGTHEDEILYQKTLNLYPHIDKEGKGDVNLLKTPGSTLFNEVGVGPIRGEINYNGQYYIISNDKFYLVPEIGGETEIGTINATSGRCGLAHNGVNNGKQIIIVDGLNGYIYNSEYDTFAQIKLYSSSTTDGTTTDKLVDSTASFTTDGTVAGMIVYNTTDGTKATITAIDDANTLSVSADVFATGENYEVGTDAFPDGATHVMFMDGYFVVNDPANSGRFHKSKSYDGTDWDALEFATAEQNSDELQSIISSNSERIYLVGEQTTEVWYNAGVPDFPFTPLKNGYMPYGTPAPYSVAEIDGIVFFIHQNKDGKSSVVMINGIQPQIVSTQSIARMIDGYTLENTYAWTYSYQQHSFYVLSFPTDEVTLVYDYTTNMWHEMSNYSLGYHRSSTHTFVYNKHLVGDPANGNIYELDWTVFTDNGEQITRLRRSPHIHNGDRAVRHYALWLDCKVGVGNENIEDPKIMMRYRDVNKGWSKEKVRSLGKQGVAQKVVWRLLGRSRDRVYELKVTDPCDVTFIDGYADVGGDSRVIG
ncbi:MAG: packaged DNA stabilization protein gp10 [Gammaproteobacteria bacterium]|nr:packaged DNA stabilization protein gp10 [Gammaproteobacteria bacterium]